MNRIAFLLVLCTLITTSVNAQNLNDALFDLPGVKFKAIETPDGFTEAYELMVRQPLDHNNPEAGSFYQRCYLTHQDFSNPVVLVTEGYNRPTNRVYELSRYLNANQVIVEHRFFGNSLPDSMDYRYLNLEQATADLHHVNQLIRKIYSGAIVSTGISKGGMTTLYYKYFYPEDVAVSVPYVAPMILEYKDKRIYQFLDTVGNDACRNKIEAFQTEMLKNQDRYKPLLYWFYKGRGNSFDLVGFDKAYELAVLEYSFSFWQLGHQCDQILTDFTDEEAVINHFISVSGVDFFGDQDLTFYAPFYYQMGTEMGYYGYETTDFSDYIKYAGTEPSAVFAPVNSNPAYNGSLTSNVHTWLTHNGNRIIYINGNKDTWSATAVKPAKTSQSLLLNVNGADHRTARIWNMSSEQLNQLEQHFDMWLGFDLDPVLPKRP